VNNVKDVEIYKAFGLENSDITFEEIVSIKILDLQQVYDLSIEGTHNFIANDIIAHNTFVTGFVNFTNNTAFNQTLYLVNGNVGIGTTSPNQLLTVTGSTGVNFTNTGTGLSFIVNDESGDSSPMVVDASGNIGIGTTSPGRTLEVSGSINGTQLNISGPVNLAYGTGNLGIGTASPVEFHFLDMGLKKEQGSEFYGFKFRNVYI